MSQQRLNELIERWNTDEGKPYKGSLISVDAYQDDPDNIGCMCAQGQVLNFVNQIEQEQLMRFGQSAADRLVAETLNISLAHSILLRNVNDSTNGAPAIVLTNPELVLGGKANYVLAFWNYFDQIDNAAWAAARDAARYAARDAAWYAAWYAARDAARDAAWDAARDAARAASNEIQGFDVLKEQGKEVYFLPIFGFKTLEDIPPLPADYGVIKEAA